MSLSALEATVRREMQAAFGKRFYDRSPELDHVRADLRSVAVRLAAGERDLVCLQQWCAKVQPEEEVPEGPGKPDARVLYRTGPVAAFAAGR